MKRILFGILVVSLSLFCLAGQATAVGFGAYVEGARGDGEFEVDFSSKFDVDAETKGFGFVMDTDLTDRGVFNYRLNIGYEKRDLEDNFGDTLELEGLVIANTFGFALIKQPDFRWWIGPQVRVGLFSGSPESNQLVDYDLVSFGIGAVTGFNFKAGNFCISPSIGVLTSGMAGERDDTSTIRDVEGSTTTAFLNIAVLFGQ